MTNEQKLLKIQETVSEEAKRSADAVTQFAESRRDEEIALARKRIDADEKLRYQKETADLDASITRELSRYMLESKRHVITERDRLADSVFAEVSQKLVGYTQTDDYKNAVARLIDKHLTLLTAGRSILLVRDNDKEMIEVLLRLRGSSVTVVSEPGIVLGGFRISSAGRLIDETLDEKLRQKRALFVETSGFIID